MNQSLKAPQNSLAITENYHRDGFCFPVDVLGTDEADAQRTAT